jgi:hypothetical protein
MLRTAAGGLLTTLSLVLLGAVAPASAAQAAEIDALDVSVVAVNGSGCPDATATARPLDASSFAVDSTAYFAWSGTDAPTTAVRRNCLYAIQVAQPAGWTYAVQGAEYSGYALLDDGVTGTQAARYYFQGESDSAAVSHPFTGPYNGSWTATDAFESDELVFAPCDAERLLNINTEVRVSSASAGLNWNFLNSSFTVHLVWQACS